MKEPLLIKAVLRELVLGNWLKYSRTLFAILVSPRLFSGCAANEGMEFHARTQTLAAPQFLLSHFAAIAFLSGIAALALDIPPSSDEVKASFDRLPWLMDLMFVLIIVAGSYLFAALVFSFLKDKSAPAPLKFPAVLLSVVYGSMPYIVSLPLILAVMRVPGDLPPALAACAVLALAAQVFVYWPACAAGACGIPISRTIAAYIGVGAVVQLIHRLFAI